jgi:hypothetical protein
VSREQHARALGTPARAIAGPPRPPQWHFRTRLIVLPETPPLLSQSARGRGRFRLSECGAGQFKPESAPMRGAPFFPLSSHPAGHKDCERHHRVCPHSHHHVRRPAEILQMYQMQRPTPAQVGGWTPDTAGRMNAEWPRRRLVPASVASVERCRSSQCDRGGCHEWRCRSPVGKNHHRLPHRSKSRR